MCNRVRITLLSLSFAVHTCSGQNTEKNVHTLVDSDVNNITEEEGGGGKGRGLQLLCCPGMVATLYCLQIIISFCVN